MRVSNWLRFGAAAFASLLPASAADSYRIAFEGVPAGLEGELRLVSTLAQSDREISTTAALRRAANADIEPLKNALAAAGYYAATVSVNVDRQTDAARPGIIFAVDPGPLFRITEHRILYADAVDGERPSSLADLNVAANDGADGATLQRLQQAFLARLWDDGFPAARMTSRYVEANIESAEAVAVFEFETGPRSRFGDIRIEGAERTQRDYIEKLKTWQAGETFERSHLVLYRDRLAETGVFGQIDVAPGTPEPDGTAPVIVTLEERRRRTIGAGLSYSTSEGPGGRLFFEYRNLFGRGERANVELEGSEVEQSFEVDLNKPLPGFPGSAFAQLSFLNETTDAFDARTVGLAGGLAKKWLDDRLETRAGLAFESSSVIAKTKLPQERTYFLSAPVSATWNTENDLLNPTEGVKATIGITPYTGSDTFTQIEANARTRMNFGPDDRLTAAFRGRVGATLGPSFSNIPINKRYFAGGGSSVRGYGFQAIGPQDALGDPLGGRSVIEAAVEGRFRVLKSVQLAAFADVGNVSESPFPELSGEYFLGAGGGIRYLTPVGPIRVDIAVPLDKRDGDRSFQLYISLGQPF